MASYNSYKKLKAENFTSNSITEDKLTTGAQNYRGVLWVFNPKRSRCRQCSTTEIVVNRPNGRCCLWTVPSGVTKVTFEIWSGGGGGAGPTCCNCCSHQ